MADGHFTFLHSLPSLIHSNADSYPETEKLIVGVLLGAALIGLGAKASKQLRSSAPGEYIVPKPGRSLLGFFDLFVESFVKYHDSVLGKENRRYVPFTGSIFLFILSANLLGLIPGVAATTTTVWVNVGMALVVFIHFNMVGIKTNGVIGYLKHFGGPIWWIFPLMFAIEILSTCLRLLTLNLRLYWNITADHIVVGVFTDLVPLFVPVIFYFLGTFVCFMQAFVFTTLTMVYILLASQHEEGHEDGNHAGPHEAGNHAH